MNPNKKRVVIIDHFDSFTYNLVVAFENLGAEVVVFRTDADIEDIRKSYPTHIVLSPGPGHPKDVSLFQKALQEWKARIPILGVCLGHQAIGIYFGSVVDCSPTVMHGKTSEIQHHSCSIFVDVPNPFGACRYHSLTVRYQTIDPKHLEALAFSKDEGTVMGIRAVDYPNVVGVQFHPESLFTEYGSVLLSNFLKMEV